MPKRSALKAEARVELVLALLRKEESAAALASWPSICCRFLTSTTVASKERANRQGPTWHPSAAWSPQVPRRIRSRRADRASARWIAQWVGHRTMTSASRVRLPRHHSVANKRLCRNRSRCERDGLAGSTRVLGNFEPRGGHIAGWGGVAKALQVRARNVSPTARPQCVADCRRQMRRPCSVFPGHEEARAKRCIPNKV
jgi:hypothetical protein